MPVLFKSEDGSIDFDVLVKADDNFDIKGELLGVVYAPEVRDSQGDIASVEVIKDAAYNAARNGLPAIDVRHDGKPLAKDDAYVAESFIIQKGDSRFAGFKDYSGKPVDVTGGWGVVLKVDSPTLRTAYREGGWNGISMGGVGAVEVEKSDDLATSVLNALIAKLNPNNNDGDLDMAITKDELTALLAKSNEGLAATIAAAIKTALTKEEPKKEEPPKGDDAPIFKGEATVENLRKHRLAVAKHKIVKSIDPADPESFKKAEEALAEIEKEEKGDAPQVNPDIAKLEKQLADLRKGSNQSTSTNTTKTDLQKEEDECKAAAAAMAKIVNDSLKQ